MNCGAFLRGMGAGLIVGAAVGATVSMRRKPMKTCVGRTMQSMTQAMDAALEDLMRNIG
ncbi:MAG: hypothetical protein IIV78_01430 [Oscillospiraceae bacterium]|nr:hypothetical protein [Oscillospiraceae bacterium]MBQ5739050.1 hypothetical protein [Oscillospiraceae bacterium]